MLSSEDLSRFVYGCGWLFWIRQKLRISRKIEKKILLHMGFLETLLCGKVRAIIYYLTIPLKKCQLSFLFLHTNIGYIECPGGS